MKDLTAYRIIFVFGVSVSSGYLSYLGVQYFIETPEWLSITIGIFLTIVVAKKLIERLF